MFNNIHILREDGALKVVLFHMLGAMTVQRLSPEPLQLLQRWGDCGADVIFVAPGFVMVVAPAGKSISPIEFIVLRIHRVVPKYWPLIALPPFYKVAAHSLGLVSYGVLAILAMIFTTALGCLLLQNVEKPVATRLKACRPEIKLQLR